MTERVEKNKSQEQVLKRTVKMTTALEKAISEAATNLPEGRTVLEDIDVLHSMAGSETNARYILRVSADDKFQQLSGYLDEVRDELQPDTSVEGKIISGAGNEIQIGRSLRSILDQIVSKAQKKAVATDDILEALIQQDTSVLSQIFDHLEIPFMRDLFPKYKEMIGTEKEIAKVEYSTFPDRFFEESADEQRRTVALRESTGTEKTVFSSENNEHIRSEENQKDTSLDVLIHPKWVGDLLSTIDQAPMSVIVTDQREIADAVIQGARKVLSGDTGKYFEYRTVTTIDPGDLIENPTEAIQKAVQKARGGILYVPNIYRYTVALSGTDVSMPIRKALARRELKVVTTVTEDQWKKKYDTLSEMEAVPLFPDPPSVNEAIQIILAQKDELERQINSAIKKDELEQQISGQTKIAITEEAAREAVIAADRYYRQKSLPGSAAEILRRAGLEMRYRLGNVEELQDERIVPDAVIHAEDAHIAVEKITGIPVKPEDPEKLLHMEDALKKRIVGQDHAIAAVSDAIRRARAGLNDPKRPIGSFQFIGPSGVGKSELGLALAEFLFDDEAELITFDMSEYQEKHNVARLIGAPPGYTGYEAGGQLTEPIRKNPYRVVMFDEIEKADPEVWNMLLQILENGRLTDGQGRVADFRNTVIIMTSNVGSEWYRLEGQPDNEGKIITEDRIEKLVMDDVKQTFRPEFLNRIDNIVQFKSLKPENMLPIVEIQEQKLNKRLNEKGLSIRFSDEIKNFLAEEGYEPEYGARPLRRKVEQLINSPLSVEILSKKFTEGDTILVMLDNGEINFTKYIEGQEDVSKDPDRQVEKAGSHEQNNL